MLGVQYSDKWFKYILYKYIKMPCKENIISFYKAWIVISFTHLNRDKKIKLGQRSVIASWDSPINVDRSKLLSPAYHTASILLKNIHTFKITSTNGF